MSITTTCGHLVESNADIYPLSIRGYARSGGRALRFGSYCPQCKLELEFDGQILYTQKDQEDWLFNRIDG